MFNLPLSQGLDINVKVDGDNAIQFKSWDGRGSLTLTIEEAKNLVQILKQNEKMIARYLSQAQDQQKQ